MFRLYFLTFTGEYRSAGGDDHGHDDHGHDDHGDDSHGYAAHPHANGANITVPLAVLAVGAPTASTARGTVIFAPLACGCAA